MVLEVETYKMLNWYDNVRVGQEYEPLKWRVTPETNDEWLGLLGDPTSWYHGDPSFREAIVHPCLLGPEIRRALDSLVGEEYSPPGQVLVQEEHEYFVPVKVGRTLSLYTKVVDKYIKRGRYYYVTECSIVGEDGTKLAWVKYTMLISGLKQV